MPTLQNIIHYRGDTYDAVISIDGYEASEGDTIVFGMRENIDDTSYIIQKTIPVDTMRLYLSSAETQAFPEDAVYDIQLTFTDEDDISHTKTFVYGNFHTEKDVVR